MCSSSTVPDVLGALALILLIVSCGLPDWTTTEATVVGGGASSAQKGDVYLGLWEACAKMPCREGGDNGECETLHVFSKISECRQGHCVKESSLGVSTNWDDNKLCDRSAAAAGFSLLAIFTAIGMLLVTSWRSLAGRTILWEKGAWLSLLAAIFSTCAWGIWLNWSRRMNKEPEETRGGDLYEFDRLALGPGFGLQVLCSIMLYFNAVVCSFQAGATPTQNEQTEQLNEGGNYDDGQAQQNRAYEGPGQQEPNTTAYASSDMIELKNNSTI